MAKNKSAETISDLEILEAQIIDLVRKPPPKRASKIIAILRKAGWDRISIKIAFDVLIWDKKISMVWEVQMRPSECECGNAQDLVVEHNGLKYWFHWCEIVKCWVYQLIPGQKIMP